MMSFSISLLLSLEFQQESPQNITHSFLVCGAETYWVSADGKIGRRYPKSTRDGWVLSDGHWLLAVSKCKEYPGGAVVEIDAEGRTLFEFKGGQSEVDTVQPLTNGNLLLTESGKAPRLLEVDRGGKIVVEVALRCQTQNA
ncbi:MAG TPA: hypothetical protein VKU80_03545, partial [Planctomycetota bacterium]|nr:hypothetical protein [Planctomycetota bacterium]